MNVEVDVPMKPWVEQRLLKIREEKEIYVEEKYDVRQADKKPEDFTFDEMVEAMLDLDSLNWPEEMFCYVKHVGGSLLGEDYLQKTIDMSAEELLEAYLHLNRAAYYFDKKRTKELFLSVWCFE